MPSFFQPQSGHPWPVPEIDTASDVVRMDDFFFSTGFSSGFGLDSHGLDTYKSEADAHPQRLGTIPTTNYYRRLNLNYKADHHPHNLLVYDEFTINTFNYRTLAVCCTTTDLSLSGRTHLLWSRDHDVQHFLPRQTTPGSIGLHIQAPDLLNTSASDQGVLPPSSSPGSERSGHGMVASNVSRQTPHAQPEYELIRSITATRRRRCKASWLRTAKQPIGLTRLHWAPFVSSDGPWT